MYIRLQQDELHVLVCEVHSQDDVFLCILVAVGVDNNHVAHPV